MTNYRQGTTRRKGSKFHDEGKWENFIAPLLPKDCTNRTFVEMGCNLGMYLGLAKKKGFKNVWGVEKDKKIIQESKGSYNILHEEIGKTFVPRHLPVADVTLLANVHYHIQVERFLEYMDTLSARTLYCIIVSTDGRRLRGIRFHGRMIDIPRFFTGWTIVDSVSGISRKGDPSPRKLFSIILKSNKLVEVDIDEYLKTSGRVPMYDRRFNSFIKESLNDPDFEPSTHPMVKSHQTRTPQRWQRMVIDIAKHGLKRPVVVSCSEILDGYHRMMVMKYLGYKKIIARIM